MDQIKREIRVKKNTRVAGKFLYSVYIGKYDQAPYFGFPRLMRIRTIEICHTEIRTGSQIKSGKSRNDGKNLPRVYVFPLGKAPKIDDAIATIHMSCLHRRRTYRDRHTCFITRFIAAKPYNDAHRRKRTSMSYIFSVFAPAELSHPLIFKSEPNKSSDALRRFHHHLESNQAFSHRAFNLFRSPLYKLYKYML